jgi:hypothetical protein
MMVVDDHHQDHLSPTTITPPPNPTTTPTTKGLFVGIRFNFEDPDYGHVWMEVERLENVKPPTPPKSLATLMSSFEDPTQSAPDPTEFAEYTKAWQRWSDEEIVRRKIADVYQQFFALYQKMESDAQATVKKNGKKGGNKADAALIKSASETSSGSTSAFEMFWGLGRITWEIAGKEIDHPVLEIPIRLSIREDTGAIVLCMKEFDVSANAWLTPFEELLCPGTFQVRESIQKHLEQRQKEQECGNGSSGGSGLVVNPFDPRSYEAILHAFALYLSDDGKFTKVWNGGNGDFKGVGRPKKGELIKMKLGPESSSNDAGEETDDGVAAEVWERIANVCAAKGDDAVEGRISPVMRSSSTGSSVLKETPPLLVTDEWLIYTKTRSDNYFVQDIELLSTWLRTNKRNPAFLDCFVTEPQDAFTQEPKVSDENEALYYFPKDSNAAQIGIMRQLAQRDLVVVEGPPGTGKTHTICNIICHFLASGKRILAVSKGETALSVLRDQLPDGVRDLVVSLTAGEYGALKHLCKVAEALVERVSRVNQRDAVLAAENKKKVEDSVRAAQDHLGRNHSLIQELARAQLTTQFRIPKALLTPAGGGKITGSGVGGAHDFMTALDVAFTVCTEEQSNSWLEDQIEEDAKEQFEDRHIEEIRHARLILGPLLTYVELAEFLPPSTDLLTSEQVGKIHRNMLEAESLQEKWHLNANNDGVSLPSRDGKSDRVASPKVGRAQKNPASSILPYPALLDLHAGGPHLRTAAEGGARTFRDLLRGFEDLQCLDSWLPSVLAWMGRKPKQAEQFMTDLDAITENYKSIVDAEVDLPDGAFADDVMLEKVLSACERAIGELDKSWVKTVTSVFGLFGGSSESDDVAAVLAQVKIAGRKPADAAEWRKVQEFLGLKTMLDEFTSGWEHVRKNEDLLAAPSLSTSELAFSFQDAFSTNRSLIFQSAYRRFM